MHLLHVANQNGNPEGVFRLYLATWPAEENGVSRLGSDALGASGDT